MVTSDTLPGENTPKPAHLHYLYLTTRRERGEELSGLLLFAFRYFGVFPIGNLQRFCTSRNSDLFPGHSKLAGLPLTREDVVPEGMDSKLKTEHN